MRKPAALLLSLAVLAACSTAEPVSPTLEVLGLNCPVRSVYVTTRETDEHRAERLGRGDTAAFPSARAEDYEATFDDSGNLTTFEFLEPADDSGRVSVTRSVRLSYDSRGRVTQTQTYDSEPWVAHEMRYAYDGDLLILKERSDAGSYGCYRIFENDGVTLTEERVYYDNELAVTCSYEYDGERLARCVCRVPMMEDFSIVYAYTYDGDGRPVSVSEGTRAAVMTYNDHGLPESSSVAVFRLLDPESPPLSADDALRDALTDMLLDTDNPCRDCRYEYGYDRRGNWTTRTVYCSGGRTPAFVTTRDIRY